MGHQDSDSIYTGPSGLHILQPPTSPSPWRHGESTSALYQSLPMETWRFHFSLLLVPPNGDIVNFSPLLVPPHGDMVSPLQPPTSPSPWRHGESTSALYQSLPMETWRVNFSPLLVPHHGDMESPFQPPTSPSPWRHRQSTSALYQSLPMETWRVHFGPLLVPPHEDMESTSAPYQSLPMETWSQLQPPTSPSPWRHGESTSAPPHGDMESQLQPPTSPSPWRYGVNFNCIKLISFANDCLCQAWFHLLEHCVKEDYTVKKFMTINEHQVILKSHLACYWPKPIKKQQFQIIANFLLEILNLWSREQNRLCIDQLSWNILMSFDLSFTINSTCRLTPSYMSFDTFLRVF